ncbi:unnamed protein product [Alternaria sp. RS040]
MKYYAAQVFALASIATAFPHPQLPSLPSFSLPTGGLGSGLGSGLGGGLSLPTSLPSLGGGGGLPSLGGGSGLPSLGGGGGLPSLGGGLPSLGGGGGGFSLPTNLPSLGGGGFSLPTNLPSLGGGSTGTSGSGLSSWLSGLGGGLGGLGGLGGGAAGGGATTTADAVVPSPSKTGAAAAPSATGGGNTGGAGTIGANCQAQSGSSNAFGGSENGIVDKNCCTDMTIVFARGTGEMGNVGSVSGPPMFKAIREKLGNDRVTVQGVDYAASAAGNANLGGDGGQKMADLVKQAKSQCPDTKVIVSGYSQGAMVVHNAFSKGLSATDVSGAVMFGDPLKRQAISGLSADKIKQFCGTADQICGGGGDGGATGSHLSYGSSADAAASFAIQAAGLA